MKPIVIISANMETNTPFILKRFLPEHWEQYRFIRLEALQTNPDLFGSQYQQEAAKSAQEWQALLQNDLRAIFG
jgi:hypothetical protein